MRMLSRAGLAITLSGALLASSLAGLVPAAAADLGPATQVVETDKTGARVSATRVPVSFGSDMAGSVDVGTGNLNASFTAEGVSFAHNSLTPKAAGAGTKNAWRVSGLGTGTLYASSSNVVLVDASGQKVTFTPVSGSTTAFTAPPEARYTLSRTSTGYTVLAWDSQTTTHFTAEGRASKVVDRFGNTSTITVDAQSVPTKLAGWQGPAAARTTWMTSGAAEDTVGVGSSASSLLRSWKLGVSNGRYSVVTNPRGKVTTISYDSAGRISKVEAPGGNYTKIAYDSKGRVVSVATPGIGGSTSAEAVTRFAYPDATKTLVAGANTDPGAAVNTAPHTTYTLTAAGQRVSAVTDADGRKQSKTYTPQMTTASSTSGEGDSAATSTFQYGANSGASMTSATGPGGESGAAAYQNQASNAKYSPSTTTDARGNKRTYSYSGAGAVSKSTDALAASAELSYNADGTVSAATAPGNTGNPTRYKYNADHQLTGMTPATGGSLKAESYAYDSLGRVSQKTTGRGATVSYSYEGSTSLVTKIAATPAGASTPDAATEISYDSSGRPTTVVDSAKGKQVQKTNYTYSTRGELLTKTVDQAAAGSEVAQSTTMSYGYDREGRMTSKSVGGFTHTYTYSSSGALTKLTYPEGTAKRTVNFGVDDQGRRTDTWYGSETSTPEKGWEVWKHVDYDVSGNIARQTVKRSGALTPTTDNPEGIQTLDDKQYCYKPGVDPRSCAGSTVKSVEKIQAMYTKLAGASTGYETKYTYDKAGRLASVDTPGSADGRYVYTYDSRGNRVKTQRVTATASTTDDDAFNAQNQVTSDGWGYDADGNLVNSAEATSVYNAANQNVSTKLADGSNTTTNVFAGVGQQEMVSQSSSKNGSYVYAYGASDRFGNPMIEKITHEGRTAFVEHDPVTDEPLFLRDTDKTSVHMYIADPIDSDIRMVKDDGGSSDYKEFDPFGAAPEKYSPRDKDKFDPYRYRYGIVDHGGTGRYLFGARHYDPNQGVWVEQDSLDAPLDPVNANRYAYAGGDPINNYDPAGLWAGVVSLELCAGGCMAFGVTFDRDDAAFDLGFGGGGDVNASLNGGFTSGEPVEEANSQGGTTCSAAYGIGGYGGRQDNGDIVFGGQGAIGGGCRSMHTWSWPLPWDGS